MCHLIKTQVKVEKVIQFLERCIEQERLVMQAHELIEDDQRYLRSDAEITETERLLSFLRRCA